MKFLGELKKNLHDHHLRSLIAKEHTDVNKFIHLKVPLSSLDLDFTKLFKKIYKKHSFKTN